MLVAQNMQGRKGKDGYYAKEEKENVWTRQTGGDAVDRFVKGPN